MTDTMTKSKITKVMQSLEAESKALKRGDIENLAELAHIKNSQLEQLETLDGLSAQELTEIKAKVSENQELLLSAMDGIRFAANRLQQLQETRGRFDTYDQNGMRSKIQMNHKTNVEKHA